jgi:lipooligosaccharide transport system permease protein
LSLARIAAVVGWHARGYRRLWRGTITVSFLNPIFFLLSIGVLLGSLVDRRNPDLGGLSYLEFVAPALLATTAMQTASSQTTYPVLVGIKWLKTYHAAVATPVRVPELVAGVLGWAGVRIAMAVVVFAAIAGVGGAFASPLAALAPLAALLCGLAFAAAIGAFTSTLEDDQALPALFRFGLIPLFLFSGTFFPVEQLPDWLEPVAWTTPLWHGVELCRDLAAARVELLPDAAHVLYLVALAAVGAVVMQRSCARRLGG